MNTFEYDLRYLQAGLEAIESFLLSDEVFWPIGAKPPGGGPEFPQLTLGGLLLAKERLAVYPISPDQEVQRSQILSSLDGVRAKWRAAWEKKAQKSYSVRLRMWGNFLDEYKSTPHEHADRYTYEVRLRVMLQLLQAEGGGQLPAEANLLSSLDEMLKSVLKRVGFIWEAEIQAAFPEQKYWYLYGQLPS